MGLLSFSGTVGDFLIWLNEQKEENMNLVQIQEQAEHKYSVNTKHNKRISALESQCEQLKMDVAMLHTIITNMNEALAEQKIKPLGSGKNSPVFY